MKKLKVFVQLFFILSLMTGLLALGLQNQQAQAKPVSALSAWTLEWADEFSGAGALNSANWLYDLGIGYGCATCANWGTGEIETMTNSTANVNQTGGHLAITPLHTGTNPVTGWTSGRVETQRTDFQPPAGGAMALEASIQLPNVSGAAAQGYWPAFWALGAPFRGVYTNWPSVGEFDVMENINGIGTIYGTLHCGSAPGGPCNENSGIGMGTPCSTCNTAYHTYRIEYDRSVSPEQLRWYLDGVQYFTVNANQVDAATWSNATNHGFFIILNVAIGGGWPGNPTSATVSGVPMNVDYVRVYTASPAGVTPSLSLNKPVVCSSTEAGATPTPCSNAVDGNPATRWSSAATDPQSIYVDLGAPANISRVLLNWETALGKDFQIQTSNDAVTWATIQTVTGNTATTNDLTVSGSGRYVRVLGTARGTQWGYSLWEFAVYGVAGVTATPSATATGPTPTVTRTPTVSSGPIYKDPNAAIPDRVNDLLSRMTLDEKIGQMIQSERGSTTTADVSTLFIGSILNGGGSPPDAGNTPAAWADMYDNYQRAALSTRLGIPFIYGFDAVHGANNMFGATMFPHNIGLGATRDPDLIQRISLATAEEIAGTGIDWTFAPCLCVARNERWGRTYESFSENPTLVGTYTTAIDGYQGTSLNGPTSILATAKHYMGDGGTINGTNTGNTVLSEADLRAQHLAPYLKAIEHNVGSFMVSYSSWNGLRMHAQKYLITDVLKNELGFKGIVITDWNGIHDLDGTYTDQIRVSVNAGIDMFMEPTDYKLFIPALRGEVNAGRVSMSRIDDAVSRILTKKFELGLFEKPFADRSFLPTVGSAAHRAIAREAVRKSLVVLKNDNNILPLSKNTGKIFVAGKNADDIGNQSGGWTISWQGASGNITPGTTILQGIRNTVSGATVTYDKTAATINSTYSVAVVVVGETPYAEGAGDRTDLALDTEDLATLARVKASGVPTVVIVVSGRPMIITNQLPDWKALVAAWLPGTEGQGVADVLFGDFAPTGKLSFSWPRSMAQLPINVGDAVYDPLFAYDFGLTYGTPVTVTPTRTPTVTATGVTSTPTVTATVTLTPTGPATPISQNKPVTCSSEESAATRCANAVDGNLTTRWSSAFSDPQWISVDLGANANLNRVVLNWEAAYATAYQIQTSNDGVTWATIKNVTGNTTLINDFAVAGSGRYVRMLATSRATVYGISLWEFQVYGSTGPVNTLTPTPTPSSIPSADFTGTPLSGSAPLTVEFTAINSALFSCTWSFGDGTSQAFPGSCPVVTHVYTTPGSYSVSLSVVKISSGVGNSKTKTNYVVVSGPSATPTQTATPTATFTKTPTPTQTATPTQTLTPAASTCKVTFRITGDWGANFNSDVIITNLGSTPINGWSVVWTFPGNQTITNLWNGSYSQSGATVRANNAGWNGTIAANGGTSSMGFSANYSGANTPPTSATVNGMTCLVAP